jgi:dienelactone hydrolase
MPLAACGSSTGPSARRTDDRSRLRFAYDASRPLQYVNPGRVDAREDPIAVEDVSFRSGGQRVEGYLVSPSGSGRHPAVVLVHGAGGDRGELLERARALAGRNMVALTITEPSRTRPPAPSPITATAALTLFQKTQVGDVVAVRRAVDLLRALPQVDPDRIGYLGWSAGARTGTLVAASEPRIKAFVLLSAGAAQVGAYVANAPPGLGPTVRRFLRSIDPIRYIALARPGSILLEDGRRDAVVPAPALRNIIEAAPSGTTVRWYDAPHELNDAAYRDAFDWLARKL